MDSGASILAFDLGTRSLKAACFDRNGRRIGGVQVECGLRIPRPGWAEQDPDDWWDAVGTACRRLREDGMQAESVAAVSFCAQMCGTVPLAADGRIVHPALIWLDTRSRDVARRITGGWPRVAGYGLIPLLRWLWTTNGAPSLAGKDPTSKIVWLRDAQPRLWDSLAHVVDAKDFLIQRCTGQVVTTPDCAHLTWLMDSRTNRWSRPLLDRLGLPEEILPRIVAATDRVGNGLTQTAAAHLGLRPGVPVVAGAGDLTAFALAAGDISDGAPHVYLGTGGWCAAHCPGRRVDPLRAIGSIRAADPRRYLLVAAQETAGACLDLTARLLGIGAGPEDGAEALTHLAETAPPGANGLVFLPWLFGERAPVDDPLARGGFLNLSLEHGRADMARAVLEGVALNTRWAATHLLRLARTRPDQPVALMGGGAQGDLMGQILADVLERPVRRIADAPWAGTQGAAMCAAVALGWHPDLAAAAGLARFDRTFQPRPALAEVYRAGFDRLVGAYRNNRSWFRQIASDGP